MATSFGTGGGVSSEKNMRGGKSSASQSKSAATASRGGGTTSSAKAKAKATSGGHQATHTTNDKAARAARASRGVSIPRLFTRPGTDPLENGAPGMNTVTG